MPAATTDHLWRHFTAAGASRLVIDRGEGCHIWDTEGNRYLDALSALYCVNIGYGPWPEISEAAKRQLDQLPFFTNWVGFATPPSLELAEKVAELVPIDVGRTFFVGGGSEAIESALKIARQYHRLRGDPPRYKFVTRRSAYHGTTLGALSVNGSPALRAQFEPLVPGGLRAPMPYRYRCPYCSDKPECTLRCADEIDAIVENEGPETVAAVILEPVQNSAGSITPPPGYFERDRARQPRDLRAGGPRRAVAAARARAEGALRPAPRRAPDGRRRARRRLLLLARAREGQGDEGDVPARRARRPHQDVPDAAGARARRLHALRRPRRDLRTVRAAARRRAGGVRRDGRRPAPGAGRGVGTDLRGAAPWRRR